MQSVSSHFKERMRDYKSVYEQTQTLNVLDIRMSLRLTWSTFKQTLSQLT